MNNEKRSELMARREAAAHRMQTGVAFEHGRGSGDGSPKHLRVGVNTALVDHGALAKILIDKGIITEEEYLEAIVLGMEAEADHYAKRINDELGTDGRVQIV